MYFHLKQRSTAKAVDSHACDGLSFIIVMTSIFCGRAEIIIAHFKQSRENTALLCQD